MDYKDIPELKEFLKSGDYFELEEALNSGYCGASWHEPVDDIGEVAERFPDLLFVVEGWGDERDDMWVFWAQGQKTYLDYWQFIPPTAPDWAHM